MYKTRVQSRSPHGKGIQFFGGKGCVIIKYRDNLWSFVQKTAEPIKMSFASWARMGPRNHVLDDVPQVLRDVAMATNFGTKIAITGFV